MTEEEQLALAVQRSMQGVTDSKPGGGEVPAEVWRVLQQPISDCIFMPICTPGYTTTNADTNSDILQLLQWVVSYGVGREVISAKAFDCVFECIVCDF